MWKLKLLLITLLNRKNGKWVFHFCREKNLSSKGNKGLERPYFLTLFTIYSQTI